MCIRDSGHVAAVAAQAKALGLPELLGPAGKERDIAYALILARVVRPASKLATTSWWSDTTLVADLGLAGIGTDEAYAAVSYTHLAGDGAEVDVERFAGQWNLCTVGEDHRSGHRAGEPTYRARPAAVGDQRLVWPVADAVVGAARRRFLMKSTRRPSLPGGF